jgi:sirohydrochlorin cobaltochelatase
MTMPAPEAIGRERGPQKPAIVLAAFGSTDPEGLRAILKVRERVRAAFPGYDVHLAFTSGIIRNIWRKRAGDQNFRQANETPPEIYDIVNPLTCLAQIQENGPRGILVQSLHISNGSEFGDL